MACLLGIALLPMFVEGINLMWHFGSYNGYTLRNGFLIAFTLLCMGAYYAQKCLRICRLRRSISNVRL